MVNNKYRLWEYGKLTYDIIWPYIEDVALQTFFNDNQHILTQFTGFSDIKEKGIYQSDYLKVHVIQYYEQRSFPEYVDLKEYSVIEAIVEVTEHDGCFWAKPIKQYETRSGDLIPSYLEEKPLFVYFNNDYAEYYQDLLESDDLDEKDIKKLGEVEIIGNKFENHEFLKDKE